MIVGKYMSGSEKKLIGEVVNYLTKIGVAIVDLTDTLVKGDSIQIEGATTNFQQKVDSMQIHHKVVEKAKKGDSIGLKIIDRCRKGDIVYKLK